MYNYLPIGVHSAKALADEEREERELFFKNNRMSIELARDKQTFSQIANEIVRKSPEIKFARLNEFYNQIVKGNGELLVIDEPTKEIYIKLLNFQVPKKARDRLATIGGSMQYLRGNDEKQSKKVNMDYFSVRIDKMPTFSNQLHDANMLFKKIRNNFLTLSKGNKVFESNCRYLTMKGHWQFLPYPKNPNEELKRWNNELGGTIFKIDAKSDIITPKKEIKIPKFGDIVIPSTSIKPPYDPADDGAVLESEISQNSWIFTTVFTPESNTQPFSGHRQFGIHKDEEGNYRFFARAIDRVWPEEMISYLNGKECSINDYFIIADATWNNLMQNVSMFVNKNGGKSTVMPSETQRRIDFNIFFSKFRSERPVNFIGNVEQFK